MDKVMDNKKHSYLILLFGLLLVITFITALYLNIQEKKNLHRNGITTIGTIYDVGAKYFKVRYSADGKTYASGEKEPFQYLKEGEEFDAKYDPNDPSKINIYYDNPVFSIGYEYDHAECNSLEKTASILTFTYYVDGRKYTRETYFKEGKSLNRKDYIVKYRVNDPEIGYLIRK